MYEMIINDSSHHSTHQLEAEVLPSMVVVVEVPPHEEVVGVDPCFPQEEDVGHAVWEGEVVLSHEKGGAVVP